MFALEVNETIYTQVLYQICFGLCEEGLTDPAVVGHGFSAAILAKVLPKPNFFLWHFFAVEDQRALLTPLD